MKKLFLVTSIFVVTSIVPAHAQFKNLGKMLEKTVDKTVDKVTKKATDMATDAALEVGANKASDKLIKFLDSSNKLSATNSQYTTRLKNILEDNFQKVENKPLDIKVYETSEANVVTLNNGSIRIYSGMMDILKDEEIRALIAMQAGHIKTGNIRDNLLVAISGDNLDDMTESQLEKVLSLSGSKIKTILNEILQLPYSHAQNKNADNYAKKFLKKNGGSDKDYSNLISKLRRLAQVDLDSKSTDSEDQIVQQASVASSFIKVNSLR